MKKRKQPSLPGSEQAPRPSVEEQILKVVAERRLTFTVAWTGTLWEVVVCGPEDGSWGTRSFKVTTFTGAMNVCYNWMFVNGWVGG